MSHRELDFVQKGVSVIFADHSNTERGYHKAVKEENLPGQLNISVTQVDRQTDFNSLN